MTAAFLTMTCSAPIQAAIRRRSAMLRRSITHQTQRATMQQRLPDAVFACLAMNRADIA